MMNCFEARQEFPALWRKSVSPEQRTELTAHLATCAKCDHAFRVFALTAPVLHSTDDFSAARAVASGGRVLSPADRPRRFASSARAERSTSRWLVMSAAAVVFVLASGAAYISISAPRDSLADALSAPDAAASSETAADVLAPELPTTESDIAS
jgi:anti-sigma factor RsiW